ncbi:MAG: CinA family protein [Alphaproteobacteria bacterium]|jgi:PncC family amidohydrolase|nr:CinA family protein [Alphaproteobacteria bacterium]
MSNLDLAAEVGALLKERGETVAVSESSAGGLVSANLLSISGASKYFLGGGVIYTYEARDKILGISDADMKGLRSSSEPYALLCAQTMRNKLGATWGLAETGASGPTGNRYGDAAGHTCLAVSGPIERVITLETADNDREANMWRFTKAALDLLLACVKEKS